MQNKIAKVRLAIGNPGWFDPLTNIHLTMLKPEADIYEGMNVTNIKKGVGISLYVVEGSLEPSTTISTINETQHQSEKPKEANTKKIEKVELKEEVEVKKNNQEVKKSSNKKKPEKVEEIEDKKDEE